MGRLEGKVATVLGASAEAGSGWAVAEALAREGAKVVVGARSIAPLQRLADQIDGVAVACDAGDEAQIANMAKIAIQQYGRLDIAVNAAFVAPTGHIATTATDEILAAYSVNLLGSVFFVRHMADAIGSDGSIILFSSSSSTNTIMPYFPYACSKAALDCLVRYAALEYGPRRIRVNSILPGAIKSSVNVEMFAIPGMEDAFAREVPLGRVGLPQDYADVVLWLADQAFVTGVNLPVSGGNQLTRSPYPSELPIMS